MMLFIALLITLLDTIHCETCKDYQECVNQAINLGSSESLTCSGAQGCYGDSGLYASTVQCFGYYGCAKAGTIKSYTGSTTCYGYRGCYGATNVYSNYGNVHCDGALGCIEAGKIQAYNDGTVYCRGYQGCYNVPKIYAKDVICSGSMGCGSVPYLEAQNVFCNGESSCQDTTIYPDGSAALTVEAKGNDAMAGSTIDCSKEGLAGCKVTCAGTGCQGLTIVYNTQKQEIDLTPQGCMSVNNQGQDIGSAQVVMFCPTLVAAADYDATSNNHKKREREAEADADGYDPEMMFFAEDGGAFPSSDRPMDVKDVLFYGSIMINGVFM
eukprot:284736_1